MKKKMFPLWHVTWPASVVLIFAIGSLTIVNMANGRYVFNFEASPKGIIIHTDLDRR